MLGQWVGAVYHAPVVQQMHGSIPVANHGIADREPRDNPTLDTRKMIPRCIQVEVRRRYRVTHHSLVYIDPGAIRGPA